jgi:hypothetical protein
MRCLLHAQRYLAISDDTDTGKTTRETAKRLTGGDSQKAAVAGKIHTPPKGAGAAWSVFYLDPSSIASLFVLCVGV